MENMEFVTEFIAHGFVPGKDISQEDWNAAICEYMAMYEQYANATNGMIDRLNDTWNKYESIKKTDGNFGFWTGLMQTTMDISNETTYVEWLEKWFKEASDAVDTMAAMSGFKLRGNIFRDGDLPVYGVKFKDKPEWTIDFVLRPVE